MHKNTSGVTVKESTPVAAYFRTLTLTASVTGEIMVNPDSMYEQAVSSTDAGTRFLSVPLVVTGPGALQTTGVVSFAPLLSVCPGRSSFFSR